MGKKHQTNKPGGGRTNAIFRIAGSNFKDKKKGQTKEITSNLKLVWNIVLKIISHWLNDLVVDMRQCQVEVLG